MTQGMAESVFSWLSLAGAVVPPRDPNDDGDEEDEEDGGDEDDDRDPAVIREPEPSRSCSLSMLTPMSGMLPAKLRRENIVSVP